MSEEKDVLRRINNLESRLGGVDLQVKGFYKAMETIQELCKALVETKFNRGAPIIDEAPIEVTMGDKWPTLESGKYTPSLTGTIVDDIVIREVQARGRPTPIANFSFTDGVTVVKVAIWDQLIPMIEKYGKGDVVTLTGLSIKDPYEGVTQLSSTRNTTIE